MRIQRRMNQAEEKTRFKSSKTWEGKGREASLKKKVKEGKGWKGVFWGERQEGERERGKEKEEQGKRNRETETMKMCLRQAKK